MKRLLAQQKRFLIYCAIGGCCTVVSTLVFTLLVEGARMHYQAANAIACTAATALSFVLNSRYNFRVWDWPLVRCACFFGVAFVGWAASAIVLRELIEKWHFNEYSAYFISLVVVVIVQYNLNRRISFRERAESSRS